jgi:hypothetical protein
MKPCSRRSGLAALLLPPARHRPEDARNRQGSSAPVARNEFKVRHGLINLDRHGLFALRLRRPSRGLLQSERHSLAHDNVNVLRSVIASAFPLYCSLSPVSIAFNVQLATTHPTADPLCSARQREQLKCTRDDELHSALRRIPRILFNRRICPHLQFSIAKVLHRPHAAHRGFVVGQLYRPLCL